MEQWSVVETLVVILGLFAAVGAPVIKLITSISELTSTVRELKNDFLSLTAKNTDSHRRIWAHNDVQDARLDDHEKRIVLLERKE